MSVALFSTVAILLGATLLFMSERVRPDLTALIVVVALAASGVLNQQEAFAGFSRPAVITIMGIFILAEGLERTGVTERVGRLLLRVAGRDERSLAAWVMGGGAFLSLFMNNIAAASVLLPAVSVAARTARISPSRLLMPLAFSTILGGMATLLTTSNIVVSGILRDQGFRGYGLLDFAPVGLPLALTGMAYMVLIGRTRLASTMRELPVEEEGGDEDLLDIYRMGEDLFRARVPEGSSLAACTLEESQLRQHFSVSVISVQRGEQAILAPPPEMRCQVGDLLVLKGDVRAFEAVDVEPRLEILPPQDWKPDDLQNPAVVLVEVMLSPRSTLIGHTVAESLFRGRYGLNVLAIWRAGLQIRDRIAETTLQFGDALLLLGPRSQLPVLRSEPDLIVLAGSEAPLPRVRGAGVAVAIMVLTLAFAALAPQMVAEVMMGGALLMLLRRLLTLDDAYRVIDWKTVFLVAGMLPMGTAMVKSGAAGMVARAGLAWLGTGQPYLLLAVLFVLTAALTQCMSGAAVAAIMTPVAIKAALASGADPRGLAMAVALGTSMAFPTPLGHHVNILVMGQGGYTFRDFWRVGGPLALLLFVVVMLVLPRVWWIGPL